MFTAVAGLQPVTLDAQGNIIASKGPGVASFPAMQRSRDALRFSSIHSSRCTELTLLDKRTNYAVHYNLGST